jgi:hypothetical protein
MTNKKGYLLRSGLILMSIAPLVIFQPKLRIRLCNEKKKSKKDENARKFFTADVAFATLRIKN